MTGSQVDKARALHAEGMSYAAIGRQLGAHQTTVRANLLGIVGRSKAKGLTDEEIFEVLCLFGNGESATMVGRRFKVGKAAILHCWNTTTHKAKKVWAERSKEVWKRWEERDNG